MEQGMSLQAQTKPPVPVTMERLKEIAQAFNDRDCDRIVSYFTDDCTFLMASGPEPVGRRVHGKAALHKTLFDRFKLIPDMHWNIEYEYLAGDRAVSVWRVTGKHADGTALNYQGCDLWEFRDGYVHNKDTYWKIVRPD
jgi:taurine dehydrogenase small subunit